MSNTAHSRADPVVVFPLSRWCPPQETSQPHTPPLTEQERDPTGSYINTWHIQGAVTQADINTYAGIGDTYFRDYDIKIFIITKININIYQNLEMQKVWQIQEQAWWFINSSFCKQVECYKCYVVVTGCWNQKHEVILYIDGLMQERRNSIAATLELRLSCINPSIFTTNSVHQCINVYPSLNVLRTCRNTIHNHFLCIWEGTMSLKVKPWNKMKINLPCVATVISIL